MPSAAREGNHSGSACAVNEITGNNADTLHCEKKKTMRETLVMLGLFSQGRR